MKRIILCADGTGNKGGTTPDTNVFRIFNGASKKDENGNRQITYYDQGVGTSSNKVISGITGAFGFGLKKNVREMYEFLARHYTQGDEIFLFGFSRGAATVRAFAGMVQTCGLLSLYTNVKEDPVKRQRKFETKFQDEIDEAMDFYVENGALSRTSLSVAPLESVTGSWGATYLPSHKVSIKFIGVWDTVSAMGFPKDWSWLLNRFFRGIDKASNSLLPHRFYNYQLSDQVEHVYHALSLDDERRTFHPRLWREEKDPGSADTLLRPKHIEQVWFPGVHSNVGGGYERDRLSLVTLDWMMERAAAHGLIFKEGVRTEVAQDASAHGKFYDSRAGLGMYYRYAPRNLEALCLGKNKIKAGTIKIHESAFNRMDQGSENYAPGQFPFHFQIVKTPMDSKTRDCQAAKDSETWSRITRNIERFVDWRKRLYTIFAESTLLLVLFAWFFWVTPQDLYPLGNWRLMEHLADILNYVTPEFMEGLINYSFAKHPLIGLGFFLYAYLHYKILKHLRNRTGFFCRQAKDHLLEQNPATFDGESRGRFQTTGKPLKNLLADSGCLILIAVSILVFFVNILATRQGEADGMCRCVSNEGCRAVSQCEIKASVEANRYWNHSGISLERGAVYRVDIEGDKVWHDASQRATPTGWETPEKGWSKFLGKTLARDTDKGLFHLMGAVQSECRNGRPYGYQFPIEIGKAFTANLSGELYTFANDLPFMYWNNHGEITIRISRISGEPCE